MFWQSIANSTNPAEFEAYLPQFPNGVFRALAEARLAALRGSARAPSTDSGSSVGGIGAPASGSRVSGAPARAAGNAAGGDARPRTVPVFRPDETCAGQPAGAASWQETARSPKVPNWPGS